MMAQMIFIKSLFHATSGTP